MSKINKIRLSGTDYDIQDVSATSVVEVTQQQYDDLPASAKTDNILYIITDSTVDYVTSAQTQSAITQAVSGKADADSVYTKTETDNAITAATATKQDTLVSGTNIKTINNESILGNGNIDIQGGGKAIEAGRGIFITTGATADTVSLNLPISAGTGSDSIIEGSGTTASGNRSHAEGEGTYAFGIRSHAEGYQTIASGLGAHAEGNSTQANAGYSHAEGNSTIANGAYSHAEGNITTARGAYSHAEGFYTTANNQSEHASGQYNVSNSATTTFGDSGNTLFSVGNGTADDARHNAFEIKQNGDIYISSGGTDIKLQDNLGGGGSSYTAGDGINITNNVISVTGMVDTTTYDTYTAATDTALASKQTTLTAGTNITIIDNVISAEGGGMTEDDELLLSTALTDLNDRKIDASEVKSNYQRKGDYATKDYVATALEPYETKANVEQAEEVTAYALNDLNERFGGLKIVKITESEYEALTTKDENVLYIVVADPS